MDSPVLTEWEVVIALLVYRSLNCKRVYRKCCANCKRVYSSKIVGNVQLNCKRVYRVINPSADKDFLEFHEISELQEGL